MKFFVVLIHIQYQCEFFMQKSQIYSIMTELFRNIEFSQRITNKYFVYENLLALENIFMLKSYLFYPFDSNNICKIAAFYGNLKCLQWARSKNYHWDEFVCEFAAMNGHLHILQWARKKNCPWNESVCINAVIFKHFHILQWALQQKCPFHKFNCLYFARDPQIIEFLEKIK